MNKDVSIVIGLTSYDDNVHPKLLLDVFMRGLGRSSFCSAANIGARTFDRWVEGHPEFCAAYELAKECKKAFFEERLLDAIDSSEVNTTALLAAARMVGGFAQERDLVVDGFDPNLPHYEQYKCIAKAAASGRLSAKEVDTMTRLVECGIKVEELTDIKREVREIKEHIGYGAS